ncbi:hypothetical protein RHSIM_Rhsim13G0202600 [Rhododendron simsii]|uniref:KHA domain-containing protein n=1 Tax=Rhododendron simsii TaxID=118357 RepID=A0A834FXS2_RHOSS|nr:hypothetical protein RHSIM_Rhsim13G0202600 [Rhododendron simsii]
MLRLNRSKLMKLIRENTEDRDTIMNNLLKKLRGTESFCYVNQWEDPSLNMGDQWVYEGLMERESFSQNVIQELPHYLGNGQFGPTRINGHSKALTDQIGMNKLPKRVNIHIKSASQEQLGKLIFLPDSLEDLLRVAGENFGNNRLTKVVNAENAEIEDISVVRDGDTLFLLEGGDYQSTDCN